ncbi:TPA: hypothetical protein I7221_21325 [Vibrio vulnificus]|nr:hypothetical protein [Vibrio vulnificus]HDY7910755.1 hypothetical protein [Vibrio vulnificus]HDY8100223.1 hypothetical protein [Vibrio vulnificus]
MNIHESIIFGVLSGVLTAMFIFIVKEFWLKVLLPWYQDFKYQGADISGSWFAEYEFNEPDVTKSTYSVVLVQNAHKVEGSMQFTFVSENRKFNVEYKLEGQYWEGYLNLSCRSKDKKMYSHGSMFLKLINNGSGLLGQFNFRHAFEDKVVTFPLGLDRN